jgi:signal transduction histidine kinase/CheY-like chemotaxis protein
VDVAFAGGRLDEARKLLSGAPDALIIRVVGVGQWSVDTYEDGVFDVIEEGPAVEAHASRALLMATRFLAAQAARTRLAHVVAHRDRLATLGLFATGVAHEISNPGSAILTNIELLRDEVGATSALPRERQLEAFRTQSGEWIEALDDCIGASQRIVSIVRGLNALSRRGRDGAPRLVDLNEELSTILRLIGKEVHFRSQVELRLDPALPPVQAAPHSVTQILTNLLLNALQAIETAPVGARHVSLATRFDEATVGFEVTDSGAGLAPELLARAFDPFLVTEGLGAGFGLSITRELAEEAGAELSVESARGTGTTIRVTFPRPAQAPLAAPRADAAAAPSPRLRLLVVDDDELLLRSLTRLLASHFDVRAAKSVTQALELLSSDDGVDVVLADVVMPDESGVELFAALEQRFPRLAQRTIFISGGVRSDDLLASVERTGRPCVAKPIEVGELTRLVRAVDAG